jgi:hypothetical protein
MPAAWIDSTCSLQLSISAETLTYTKQFYQSTKYEKLKIRALSFLSSCCTEGCHTFPMVWFFQGCTIKYL